MELFSNEVINISKILSVYKHLHEDTFKNGKIAHYNAKADVYVLIFNVYGDYITYYRDISLQNDTNSLRYMPKSPKDGRYDVVCGPNGMEGYCIACYFDTDIPMPDIASISPDMDILKDKFITLYNIWFNKKPGYYVKAMRILYEIIELIQKSNENSYADYPKKRLKKAYDYILENYKNKVFDYPALARQSGLSYSYFKTVFKKCYKVSPVKFVTGMKIDYAKELLITGRYSITEIAEMCGFDNVYYFSNTFKKNTGVSPKDYMSVINQKG